MLKNLTGQNASVQLQKGECRRMFWIPEKDDSKLKVTLTEKACVTVMEYSGGRIK